MKASIQIYSQANCVGSQEQTGHSDSELNEGHGISGHPNPDVGLIRQAQEGRQVQQRLLRGEEAGQEEEIR